MSLREENPSLYRRNVRNSWELMRYIVGRVSNECFIGHYGPRSGVGYDCLTLVTRNPEGYVKTRMMHNRNGVNSTIMENVWSEIDERGIEAVAEQMITRAGLDRSISRVSSDAEWLSARVCAWVADHEHEDFFVGPHGWPRGCHTLLTEPMREWSRDAWPIEEHGPEVLLGIDRVEVSRLVFGQRTMTADETISDGKGKQVSSDEVAREFNSLEEALRQWPSLADQPNVWPEVNSIVDRVKGALGEIVRVHIPASSPYIALTFAREPNRIGVHIHSGFVDSIIELAGSYVPESAPRAWRTNLSTFRSEVTRKAETPSERFLCPEHKMDVPKYAECPICGWRPLDA